MRQPDAATARQAGESGTEGATAPSGGAPVRLYAMNPLLVGPLPAWEGELARAAALGFSAVLLAPPFAPGRTGNIFLVADHDRPHPVLAGGGAPAADAEALLAALAGAARRHGLELWLDLVLDRVAADGRLPAEQPGWFAPSGTAAPPDPRLPPPEQGALHPQLENPGVLEAYGAWWAARLTRWAAAGVRGFRCDAPGRVPPALWRRLAAAVPDARLLAWTPGMPAPQLPALAGAGFAATCDSLAWWDLRGAWLLEEATRLAAVAPAVSVPEAPFGPRLAAPHDDVAVAERVVRRHLRLGAALGAGVGWLVPMGMELGARRPLDPALDRPGDWDWLRRNAPWDLGEELRAGNAWLAAWQPEAAGPGELRALSGAEAPVLALARASAPDARQARAAALVLANPDLHGAVSVEAAGVLPGLGGPFAPPRPAWPAAGEPLLPGAELALAPGEARLFRAERGAPVRTRTGGAAEATAAAGDLPRIGIEAVTPAVDGGRFAVKRSLGEVVEVEADILCDGHEKLAAVLLWRPGDAAQWREVPMRPLGNDRWAARFPLERLGRHLFCVEAWKDEFSTWRDGLEKKHAAGLDVALELEEGRLLVARAAARAGGDLMQLADRLEGAPPAERLGLMLAARTEALMRAADHRPFRARSAEHPVEAERTQARFASWYELFPRSQSGDPARHGTFADVIGQLPRIRAMGFDVLYFPPIHPIGRRNRKGRNNSLTAAPGDPGSPYAIGSEDGGHDAIHPELGTLEDFHALRDAAHAHGMELALDFAIQCAPDHPWLREHEEWFAWRPDGSLRYAENPPKKYEDIVNVEFYAEGAVPSLWLALRDVVRFWVRQGVKTFRVDNPHTKPLPFWEWLIADIRAQDPECIFLSEAFTRPKMMYRLAKVGFGQSYTYFTWRTGKREIQDYLEELATTAPRDFFRPNFFVNTPDINPVYLQDAGRAAFLIRAALATTLSGLWGMYNGFELCEGRPVPGKEEYLDSEKYEIRAWDWDRPGNITAEIARLNAIRKLNPALQTHLGIAFHNAFNDQVLWYRKATPDRSNVVLVAVSLDPHAAQEATVELPLWEWGLPDHAALAAEDLMRGHRLTWHGKTQRLRLDPADLPFGVWRVQPAEGA